MHKIFNIHAEETFIRSVVSYLCGGKMFSDNIITKIKNHLKIIDKNRTVMFPLTVVKKAFSNYFGDEFLY